jgi:hypothetical protein
VSALPGLAPLFEPQGQSPRADLLRAEYDWLMGAARSSESEEAARGLLRREAVDARARFGEEGLRSFLRLVWAPCDKATRPEDEERSIEESMSRSFERSQRLARWARAIEGLGAPGAHEAWAQANWGVLFDEAVRAELWPMALAAARLFGSGGAGAARVERATLARAGGALPAPWPEPTLGALRDAGRAASEGGAPAWARVAAMLCGALRGGESGEAEREAWAAAWALAEDGQNGSQERAAPGALSDALRAMAAAGERGAARALEWAALAESAANARPAASEPSASSAARRL